VVDGAWKNRLFVAVFVLIAAAQILIIVFGGEYFNVTRLSVMDWAISLLFGFTVIPAGMLVRCIPDEAITRLLSLVGDVNPDALPWTRQDIESQARSMDWEWPTRGSGRGSEIPERTRPDPATERTWLLSPPS